MIAAHSSAVIQGAGGGLRAFFLDFYFRILEGSEQARDPKLRTHYVLADGGKSDNTGLVPLIDRGTDIVIASYMGKEKVEKPFGDLLMAREQVQQLFGCEISLEGVVIDPAHKRNQEGHYVCAAAPHSASKSMLHVHPWPGANVEDFLADLKSKAAAGDQSANAIVTFLDGEKKDGNQFPQTKTFETTYDRNLIAAYYLLGKFSARRDIAPYLREKLGDSKMAAVRP